jgi:hypothetical protein
MDSDLEEEVGQVMVGRRYEIGSTTFLEVGLGIVRSACA